MQQTCACMQVKMQSVIRWICRVKLVELKIARMQCIAVFANMQTKMSHPGVNEIVVPLYIIVCPLQYAQGMLCTDVANSIDVSTL